MTAPQPRVPGVLATTGTIAALTLTRILRGRALWVGALIALMPVVFATLLRAYDRPPYGMLQDLLTFEQLLLAVLPALFVAAAIGEDIEDRTTTYVWSRPIPRWTVLAGKLVTLVPIVAAFVIASWAVASQVGPQIGPSAASIGALAAGAVGISMIAATIGTLVPRHGMALTICYMLFFDLPVGLLPGTLKELSVSHHVRMIADVVEQHAESPQLAGLGIAIISAVWLAIALLRIRRLEA